MKIYVLTNGITYHNIAFTNPVSATCELYDNLCDDRYFVKEIDLPFANRSVCYVEVYYGYNYGFDNIHDVVSTTPIFSCSDHARKSKLWVDLYNRAMKDPDNYIIEDNKVASIDIFGHEFIYGDVMQDMFNMKIKRIKVVRN